MVASQFRISLYMQIKLDFEGRRPTAGFTDSSVTVQTACPPTEPKHCMMSDKHKDKQILNKW